MFVKYIGPSDVRTITSEDWDSIGEERGGPIHHDDVTWDGSTNHIEKLTAAAGKWLLANDSEFVESDKYEPPPDDTPAEEVVQE